MKYLQFVMVGGKDYVDQCMSDELITENLVRNIKGAAEIGGKIRLTLSDKSSKDTVQEKLRDLGVSEDEMKALQVVEEKKLLKEFKSFLEAGDPRGASKYDQLMQLKTDSRMRGMYHDTIKLLSIQNAPKGQIVEFIDLDQQVDIKQNPNFTIGNKATLYTSMHLGENPSDSSYRRHDMNKEELVKYYRSNPDNPSNHPYTNERSYLVGRGGDQEIMKILFASIGNIPHFFVNEYFSSLPYNDRVRQGSAGISDAAMSPELRENLIKRSHIDFNQTSLLPRERVQGREVGFDHLEREKPSKKKSNKHEDKGGEAEDFYAGLKADDSKNSLFESKEIDIQIDEILSGGGKISSTDNFFDSNSGGIASSDQGGVQSPKDVSNNMPSTTVAALTVGALAAGYFIRRLFGGNAKDSKQDKNSHQAREESRENRKNSGKKSR